MSPATTAGDTHSVFVLFLGRNIPLRSRISYRNVFDIKARIAAFHPRLGWADVSPYGRLCAKITYLGPPLNAMHVLGYVQLTMYLSSNAILPPDNTASKPLQHLDMLLMH
jgi:hypothetical protein